MTMTTQNFFVTSGLRPPPSEASPLEQRDAGKADVVDYKTPSEHAFPKGPSDEVLCEAIHSTETDVWRRFGHFVPLLRNGVIGVGPGNDHDVKRLKAAAAKYEPLLIGIQARACSTGGMLAYGYADWVATDQGFGVKWRKRVYTADELEATVEKHDPQARKAMAQRFEILQSELKPRLYDACEKDAEYCDKVLRLLHKDGLCENVWTNLINYVPLNPSDREPTEELKKKCLDCRHQSKCVQRLIRGLLAGKRTNATTS